MSLALLGAYSPPQQQAGRAPQVSAAEFADAVGGTLSTGTGAKLVLRHKMPSNSKNPTATAWALTLRNNSTGWDEDFLLGNPLNPGSTPAPLLVLWHKWSTSENDTWENTSFFEEATQRGWYVIAPLSAHRYHSGIEYGQRNTKELIEFMAAWLPGLAGNRSIDNSRVYGVGFSMGAGALTSYACRHLDPTGYPFAAVINYTGTMSAARGWKKLPFDKTDPTTPGCEFRNHPMMFGGSPDQFHYQYQIASCVHLWPKSSVVDPSSDLLRNIPELHVMSATAPNDTHDNVDQCAIACAHAASLNFPWFQWAPLVGTGATCTHCWDHLPEAQSCAWLTAFNFKKPDSVTQTGDGTLPGTGPTRILADRDARYYEFTVTQTSPGTLTPFEYDLSQVASANKLTLTTSRGISGLLVDSAGLQLITVPFQLLTVDVVGSGGGATPPAPVTLEFTDYQISPALVSRNGIPQVAPVWSWNPVTQVLTINEPDATQNPTWQIL